MHSLNASSHMYNTRRMNKNIIFSASIYVGKDPSDMTVVTSSLGEGVSKIAESRS
jgi:hypothetical protein